VRGAFLFACSARAAELRNVSSSCVKSHWARVIIAGHFPMPISCPWWMAIAATRVFFSCRRMLASVHALPLAVAIPRVFRSTAIAYGFSPLPNRSNASRIISASLGIIFIPFFVYP
jgi:hypothetical protein